MYKFIGGDQKEYGPVSAEQIRQWVAEGRANGQTLVLAEGTTEWRPLASFPELAGATAAPPIPVLPAAVWSPEACLARDYELDIAAYFTRSWLLLHRHLRLFGQAVLLLLVLQWVMRLLADYFTGPAQEAMAKSMQTFVEQLPKGNTQAALEGLKQGIKPEHMQAVMLISIAAMLVEVLMEAGMSLFVLKLIRGRAAGVGDVLAGFGLPFLSLVLAMLLTVIVPSMVMVCCLVLPGLYLSIIWMFTVPLIIDRRMGTWAAMELSRKRVHRRFFSVFCVWLVAGVISFCGALVMGLIAATGQLGSSSIVMSFLSFGMSFLALLITQPLRHGLRMHAYEDIFRA
jgi:hypothetical protein